MEANESWDGRPRIVGPQQNDRRDSIIDEFDRLLGRMIAVSVRVM